jgi:hypothetical protein
MVLPVEAAVVLVVMEHIQAVAVRQAKVMMVETLLAQLPVPAVVAVKALLAAMAVIHQQAVHHTIGITVVLGERVLRMLTFLITSTLRLVAEVAACTIQALVVITAPQALEALVSVATVVITATEVTQHYIAVAVAEAAQELRWVIPL